MRIGIDFHSAEREGSGNCTYIRNLVESLLSLDCENDYFLYITDSNYSYYKKFKKIRNVHLRLTNSKNPFLRILILGVMTFIDRIDILHVQYFSPPFHKGRLVTSIHDVSFLHLPGCFREFEFLRLKTLIPLNIMKSSKVLTPSESSKTDIMKNYRASNSKIEVIYCGVKPIFKPLENLAGTDKILRGYGIHEKFILFVGRIDVRKNISALIQAFLLLKEKEKIPHQLVLVGKKNFLAKDIQRNIAVSQYQKDIIFVGYLPEDLLPVFYNMADVFSYPSLYEGFGLPCLEAISCGCPVVSSNFSSLPEVIGDAGLLVNPSVVTGLALAIHKVISDPNLKKDLRIKGLERVKKFSWEKNAMQTLEVYKKLI